MRYEIVLTQTPIRQLYPHIFAVFGQVNEATFWPFRAAAVAWCREQFGPMATGPTHKGRWDVGRTLFYFRDQTDATAFRMRWG